MTNEELVAEITRVGDGTYKDVRMLDDGTIVGTVDLLYTRGVMTDMDLNGYGHRYCYEDRKLATIAARALVTGDDKPIPGYIAERHLQL